MKAVLTIAGSDSSGGAGIQADIKTMMANGVYAMSAITAVTAQNTQGVAGVWEMTPDCLKKQLEMVFEDICPDAVKVGMVPSAGLIDVIADICVQYEVSNLVLDPVMVSTSGTALIPEEAVEHMRKKLFPAARVITPNIPETEVMTGMDIHTREDRILAAETLYESAGCAVLCKGGHGVQDASDLLIDENGIHWFEEKRIDNPNTHGTGCTLSSAIASYLARGEELETSVRLAKKYISGALADRMDLGRGSGPLNHGYQFYPSGTCNRESIDLK